MSPTTHIHLLRWLHGKQQQQLNFFMESSDYSVFRRCKKMPWRDRITGLYKRICITERNIHIFGLQKAFDVTLNFHYRGPLYINNKGLVIYKVTTKSVPRWSPLSAILFSLHISNIRLSCSLLKLGGNLVSAVLVYSRRIYYRGG